MQCSVLFTSVCALFESTAVEAAPKVSSLIGAYFLFNLLDTIGMVSNGVLNYSRMAE